MGTLALDQLLDTGSELRPRLPLRGTTELTGAPRVVAASIVPEEMPKLKLNPLTVADDPPFFTGIAAQRNRPQFIKDGLRGMYG